MRLLLPLLLALTTGVSLAHAQGRGGMRGGMGGGRPMMGGGRPAEPPSEDLLRGPYAPDSMAPKFELDSAQSARYRIAWDSMMTATRPARDSIHQAMEMTRRARMEGYQQEGQRQSELVQRLGKQLKKDEEHFDKVIRRFLSKDQWEDFKDWRKRRRETERELRRQQMEEEGPGGRMGGRRRG
ncbi:MAG TPA: hypothetical protein VF454_00970 [Gemmatimonadales bacterium]